MKRTLFVFIVTMFALCAFSIEGAAQGIGEPNRISKIEFYDHDGAYTGYVDMVYEQHNGKYYPSSITGNIQKSYKYMYQCNAAGEVVEVTVKYFKHDDLRGIIKANFDRQGRLIKSVVYNPKDNNSVAIEENYSYSSQGFLDEIESTDINESKVTTYTLFRNEVGDILRIICSDSGIDPAKNSYIFEWGQSFSVQNGFCLTLSDVLSWPSSLLFPTGLLGPLPAHDVIHRTCTSGIESALEIEYYYEYISNNNGSVSVETRLLDGNLDGSLILYY